MVFKKYACVKQHDSKDCGIACLATVAEQYGLKVPISKIREKACTDNQGTTLYGMIKAAEELKFDAKPIKVCDKNDIYKKFPKPAIAHIIVDNRLMHYVVIHEIKNDMVTVSDPAIGMRKIKIEEFKNMWTGVLLILVPSESFEKKNEAKGCFSRYLYLMLEQKKLFFTIALTSILTTIFGIYGSFYFKYLIDDIMVSFSYEYLNKISIAMIVLAVFKCITELIRSILSLLLSQNIDTDILLGYYKHVLDLPMKFFGTKSVGEIISRFTDASNIREAISSATLTVFLDSIMAVVGGIILYNQSPLLFLICFIPIFVYIVLGIGFKKPIEDSNRKFVEDNSKLISYLVESMQGIETIKALNKEDIVKKETEKKFSTFVRSVFKYGKVISFQSISKEMVQSIFTIVVMWVGTYLVLQEYMSIGTLISFNALLVYFIGPIERILNLQKQIQSAIVASERIGEILDLEVEKSEAENSKKKIESLNEDIEFKSIKFRYGVRELILDNINLKLKKGEKIAIVGESGSGKTTLAKLLMNFYDIDGGTILIGNEKIQDINKESLRDKIAYVSQETFFFSGTIKDNLLLAMPEATMDDIIDACKKAQIHDYISGLQLGYDSILEENASNLSGGQRQRLSIARALLRKADILIMDEATSNLDSITEKAIEKTIEDCTKDVTTIIIAHRLSTIMKCSKIYVMQKGKIIEEGTHNELVNRRGYYYELWNKQNLQERKEELAC